MKHLIVTEGYGSLLINNTADDALTNREAQELLDYIELKELDKDNIILTINEVKFINYVGYIRLSSCSIEILPKVNGNAEQSRKVLLEMLNTSGFLKISESELSEVTLIKENLFEIIGYLFSRRLNKEVKKGLYRSYVLENDHLHRLRGKINIKEQMSNTISKTTSVACEYDEFKTDNLLNQILKKTMDTLLKRVRNNETKKFLTHDIAHFEEVSAIPVLVYQLENIHFNRNNQRFYNSYLLAKLILLESSSLFQNGLNQNFSILFKMNELFEEYIAYLAKQLFQDVTVKDRSYKLLVNENTGRKNFLLEPDLLINGDCGKPLIIDTKWKRYDPFSSSHGIQRNDLYQMYAYLTRYDTVQAVVLLYPHDRTSKYNSGECLNTWYLEGDHSKKIKCYTINYETKKDTLCELQRIVKEL
ncbi:hypothetical protein CEF21_05105 [Bacillus sp. FJAT-42376]|uniref:McrC family protein n=1 Tax=Bacillus sp. FJAT-42376 TaxID=2014076 RepID=UPI000F4D36B5|nr:McrC family protein [Bacillus sp. FJAT-42376]AZB41727.1 hypothetical protein CEF21_05105 [Bacillus sp. FJAT-42376]